MANQKYFVRYSTTRLTTFYMVHWDLSLQIWDTRYLIRTFFATLAIYLVMWSYTNTLYDLFDGSEQIQKSLSELTQNDTVDDQVYTLIQDKDIFFNYS